MEYSVKTINEMCIKITDGAHNSPTEDVQGIYPMYSSKDMLYGRFDTENIKMISDDDYSRLVKQDCRPLENDILIIKDGNSYLKYVFRIPQTLDAVILSSIAILRPNIQEVYPDYLVYLMRTDSIRAAMANYVSGAAIPRIVLKDFKKMKLKIARDRVVQEKIASSLLQFDDLIENNTKRIKLLEQMAENLYKEWFVRFRFPGHEDVELSDSRLGKIPSTFSVLKMQDIFEYYIGGGWGNDERDKQFIQPAYVIRGTDFPYVMKGDLSTCPYRFHKSSNYKSRELKEDDIIIEVSGGTAEQPVGRTVIVTKDIIDRLGGNVICASFCKQIRLNKEIIEPLYFYYWMQFLYDTRMIDKFQLQSTGIINFKFEYFLQKGDVMIPPEKLMKKFVEIIRPMKDEVAVLAKKNANLIEQRDLLLPRLMSGKLEVK